jgi:hypothetical protein
MNRAARSKLDSSAPKFCPISLRLSTQRSQCRRMRRINIATRDKKFCTFPVKNTSDQLCHWHGNVFGMATSYGLDDRGIGVRVPVGLRNFSSPRRPDRLWGPPNLLSSEYRGLISLGVKRPGRETDNLPPANAEVEKMWIYTSTTP